MLIRVDDLAGPEIRALLEEHLRSMHELSPPESVHALDLDELRRPEVSFWTVWSDYGNDPRLTLILFTLDESTFGRELAPLRGTLSRRETGTAVVVL